MTKWNTRCRFFDEKYACDTLTSEGYKSCEECKFASPYSKKILIIKLGALGDVLRTTPILSAIRKRYPDSLIYWLVEDIYGEGKQLFENNPQVDKVLVYNTENVLRLQQEKFDILFSLEINTPGTLLANIVKADEKLGYYFQEGATSCFNKGAEAYLETAFLNHVKLVNRKKYEELIFEACNLSYNKEEPIFNLTEKDKEYAEKYLEGKGISPEDKLLGINFSSGERWPSKSWSKEKVKELVKSIEGYKIILLGGPEEKEKLKEISTELKDENINFIINDPNNNVREFASILDRCEKVIATDSFALHLATALKKTVTALFFSTPYWEFEAHNRARKIYSPLLEKYFFSMKYSEELANSISVEEVLRTL